MAEREPCRGGGIPEQKFQTSEQHSAIFVLSPREVVATIPAVKFEKCAGNREKREMMDRKRKVAKSKGVVTQANAEKLTTGEMMERAVQAQDYEKLATLGAEHGLLYLKGQERRKEPGFLPELFSFKDGKLKGVYALSGAVVYTSYTFPAEGEPRVVEAYRILPDDYLEALLTGKISGIEKGDVVLAIGDSWSKAGQVKTLAELEKSSRHGHVVAFGNVYLSQQEPIAPCNSIQGMEPRRLYWRCRRLVDEFIPRCGCTDCRTYNRQPKVHALAGLGVQKIGGQETGSTNFRRAG